MKIARPSRFRKYPVEWYSPTPAPSLRECPPMNGEMYPFLSFVGAMKIARNLAVYERHNEWCSPSRLPP